MSNKKPISKGQVYVYTFLVCMLFLFICPASALTRIDITRTNIAPVPIAIQTFSSSGFGGGDYHINGIDGLVASDLESSGLFKLIDHESYIENINDLRITPSFISWRQINASALVLIDVKAVDKTISATFAIWDIYSEKPLVIKKLDTSVKSWRRLAHKIADEVYKRFTGEPGYFDTKIAYVAVKGSGNNKTRRLAIMDHDGANHAYLTEGSNIVLTPRFSQDSRRLLYFTYEDPLHPKIKLFDLLSNKSTLLREFYGMSFAPRYTSDGQNILLSIERDGISNIVLYNVKSMEMFQLTHCTSICISPSSSPDQRKIVFNSDMGGGRNLYVANFDGSNIRRISFGEGKYTSPVWSPKGDLIAFTKMVPGEGFFIGIMRPDGSGEKILAQGNLVEGPAWAPNGRALIFEKQLDEEQTKLYKVDIVSRKEQEINSEFSATDANWSNVLD